MKVGIWLASVDANLIDFLGPKVDVEMDFLRVEGMLKLGNKPVRLVR